MSKRKARHNCFHTVICIGKRDLLDLRIHMASVNPLGTGWNMVDGFPIVEMEQPRGLWWGRQQRSLDDPGAGR